MSLRERLPAKCCSVELASPLSNAAVSLAAKKSARRCNVAVGIDPLDPP